MITAPDRSCPPGFSSSRSRSAHSPIFLLAQILALLALAIVRSMADVSTSDEKPSQHLLWSFSGSDHSSNFNWKGAPNRRDVGFSFRAPDAATLEALTLHVLHAKHSTAGAAFTLKLYKTHSYTAGPDTGALIHTMESRLPDNLQSPFLTFRFPAAIPLEGDQYYLLTLEFTDKSDDGHEVELIVSRDRDPHIQLWYRESAAAGFYRNGSIKPSFYIHGQRSE